MTFRIVRRLLLSSGILLLPVVAYAQEATFTGTVTDSTGGVLPGVVVTAVLEATGNTFAAVTDDRGVYRIPARVGAYKVAAELQGFTTVVREGLQLLVGETLVVNLQLSPSTLAETITVTAEAPLLNVSSSVLGSNIDPKQVQDMPLQGRDWGALLLLAPGSRTTSDTVARINSRNTDRIREFQTNVDGQQFQNTMGGGGQPTFSQEMIAEFQFISNRFDATQGRSSGLQVNLVTKSGTNRYAGSFRSNFRDDRFNAPDPILDRVTPDPEPAVRSDVWRPHRAQPAALLRVRRVRARAERRDVENAVPAIQRLPAGDVQEEDRRRPPRLPDLAAEPGDGPVERGKGRHALWPG
jgi:hypothetical protein